MKSTKSYVVIVIITIAFVLSSCRDNNKYTPVPFSLPKVALHYQLPAGYLDPNKQETLIRSDSMGPRTFVSIQMLNKPEADMWRIDTMTFRPKNSLSMWDTQKRGYYWLFQGISFTTSYPKNVKGKDTSVCEQITTHFVFNRVVRPPHDREYPVVDYKGNNEYWSSVYADVIGIANPIDNDLFVMAYPIRKQVRQHDIYTKDIEKDSVAIPYRADQVDSSKMICLRISLLQLDKAY